MLSHHELKAEQYRAQAALAREKALATSLPRVRETEERAAARWETLAEAEDLYIEGALARAASLREKLTPAQAGAAQTEPA